jgi:small subunit ribosomal protein S2
MKKENLVEALFSAGSHFGYSRTRRHPTVTPLLYGNKDGVDIIDATKTVAQIEEAGSFLKGLAASGKKVLFIGVKPESRQPTMDVASALHMPHVTQRWIGGILTNFGESKKRIQKLEDLKEKRATGELEKYTKKEQLLINRELTRLQKYFNGLIGMQKMPEALIVVDSKKEHNAVKEARKLGIPVVALGNTDCSLRGIDYPITANDSSVASITLILKTLQEYLEV